MSLVQFITSDKQTITVPMMLVKKSKLVKSFIAEYGNEPIPTQYTKEQLDIFFEILEACIFQEPHKKKLKGRYEEFYRIWEYFDFRNVKFSFIKTLCENVDVPWSVKKYIKYAKRDKTLLIQIFDDDQLYDTLLQEARVYRAYSIRDENKIDWEFQHLLNEAYYLENNIGTSMNSACGGNFISQLEQLENKLKEIKIEKKNRNIQYLPQIDYIKARMKGYKRARYHT